MEHKNVYVNEWNNFTVLDACVANVSFNYGIMNQCMCNMLKYIGRALDKRECLMIIIVNSA